MASGWHRRPAPTSPATRSRTRQYRSPQYRAARAAAKRVVDEGDAHCWRPDCRRWLDPTQPWHLGHDDADRAIIRGPECAPCNLKAAARKGRQAQNQATQTTHLTW